ncbi:hypothetical protein Dimus_039030 [Dionaea muscipula]
MSHSTNSYYHLSNTIVKVIERLYRGLSLRTKLHHIIGSNPSNLSQSRFPHLPSLPLPQEPSRSAKIRAKRSHRTAAAQGTRIQQQYELSAWNQSAKAASSRLSIGQRVQQQDAGTEPVDHHQRSTIGLETGEVQPEDMYAPEVFF